MVTPTFLLPRRHVLPRLLGLALPVACVLTAALLPARPARGQDLRPFLQAQLELERQLLADDLDQYAAARQRQQTDSARVAELLAGIDEQIASGTVTLGDLERRERELAAAQQTLAGAELEAGRLRQRILDHLRRTALLASALETRDEVASLRIDPVSGRWRLTLQPGNVTGFLELRLDGAAVSGAYQLGDQTSWSVRGSYNGGRLRLERIDALRGLDSVLEGELDPVRRQIDGTWTGVVLSSGGPASGTWTAVKDERPAEEQP